MAKSSTAARDALLYAADRPAGATRLQTAVVPTLVLFLLSALLLFLSLGFASTAEASNRRTALVIGNAGYTEIPELKNPVNDARDVASKLRALDFDVIHAVDLDRRGMESAIREFGRKVRKEKGDALFYYAGHGVERDGRNYLIPLRAEIEDPEDLPYKAVDVGQLLTQLEAARNGVNIIVLDACRNNPYENFRGIAMSGLASMTGPTGSLIAFATSPGDVAADGRGRNGIFTKHLLAAMSVPGATLDETFQRVRKGVAKETRRTQIPWANSSVIGDFYFTPPGKGGRSPAAPSSSEPEATMETTSFGRFEPLAGGEFRDAETGLIWYCPGGRETYSHKQAEKFAKKRGAAASGWRLPTDREFQTIISAGGVGSIDGLEGKSFSRYWVEGKNRWLGEGKTARFGEDGSVRIEKNALTGLYRACFVKGR